MSGSRKRIVIIGGVACGPKAAARARRRDPEAEIVLIEKGELLSYAGCGLPYYISGAVPELDGLLRTPYGVVRDEEFFRQVKDLDVRIRTEVVSIDRENKTVSLRQIGHDSTEQLSYDKLVLATGAKPVLPSIEGLGLDRVYCLHTPSDAKRIRESIDAGEVDHAVVIGAGLIGLEICESLFNHAVDVTVVEIKNQILPAMLDPEIAFLLEQEIQRGEIEFLTGQHVLRIEGEQHVSKVVTQEQEIETDMVIVAAGIQPNVELAQTAGLEIGETGAIFVNDYLQTSDPDIYAGGDCVECTDLVSGRKTYAPLGSTANRHGRIIGDNVTGGQDTFPGIVGTTILKVLNMNVGMTGLTEKQAMELGFEVLTSFIPSLDHAHFYPGGKDLLIKLVSESKGGRLLGAQIFGSGEVTKRIDVLATALRFQANVYDIANLDLGYSPPYSQAMEGVVHAANTIRNRLETRIPMSSPTQAHERIKENKGFVILDVREAQETEKKPIPNEHVVTIPLSELRARMHELPKDAEILCVCQVGTRGYEAGVTLKGEGFEKVAYLAGGFRVWPIVEEAITKE